MGFRIFLHSVRLVFSQLNAAFRISGLLYILTIVLTALVFLFLPRNPDGQQPVMAQYLPAFAAFAVVGLISLVLYLWTAVSWHRFVLLDELPEGRVPPFRGDRVLAYFGRGLQVALIGMVVVFISSMVLGALMALTNNSPVVAILTMLIVLSIGLVIAYRLAPVFPGAAIGQPLGIGAAWAATRGASGTIIVLAIVSAIASIVIDLPANLLNLLPAGMWLGFIWVCITGWVKLMVGASILTTLYGVYVEKRSIA
jgi:hypothetical protein